MSSPRLLQTGQYDTRDNRGPQRYKPESDLVDLIDIVYPMSTYKPSALSSPPSAR
jgi:hypothetical protein